MPGKTTRTPRTPSQIAVDRAILTSVARDLYAATGVTPTAGAILRTGWPHRPHAQEMRHGIRAMWGRLPGERTPGAFAPMAEIWSAIGIPPRPAGRPRKAPTPAPAPLLTPGTAPVQTSTADRAPADHPPTPPRLP